VSPSAKEPRMETIIAEQKVSASQSVPPAVEFLLDICRRFNLVAIPLKPRSKVPLVKWSDENWKPSPVELESWALTPGINWGVRGGENLAAIDFDSEDEYSHFIAKHRLPVDCPVVKTRRGQHIWVKPRKPIRSQRINGIEIKCLGGYVVAPPSVHPSGSPYVFIVAPNGSLPVVDLEALLNLPIEQERYNPTGADNDQLAAPSDFPLRYGKSPYPPSLCGLATKVLTRSDSKVKKLISLRCWKWHCRKCAPLLKRYWMDKLDSLSFRFILRLPTMAKPIAFLGRIGKPDYVHVVANGESWLFLIDGDVDKVWEEAWQAGYELVAGDISGDPSSDDIKEHLEQALCAEEEPLNTRRKISHSRGLFSKQRQDNKSNESKQITARAEEGEHMNKYEDNEPHTWATEVIMEPIEHVAKQLEAEGWHIRWKSEVEAIAVKSQTPMGRDRDIVELMGMLGVKLKRMGKEYVGLCPFHDDRNPSLSVNREKGLWHCFGCGRGGDSQRFFEEWQQR